MHHIPVIDKMMQIIEAVERSSDTGMGSSDLVDATGISRSTVYRILNTLSSHGILVRRPTGEYCLGYRLNSLAAKVRQSVSEEELVRIVQPYLERLSKQTGETTKFSVVKDDQAEVVAMVQSSSPMAPSSKIGSRFDLHAGAASKALLAFGSDELIARVLGAPLTRYTDVTVTNKSKLKKQIQDIRVSGISSDLGECIPGVHAHASPVRDASGNVVGAVSCVYFSAARDDKNPDLIAKVVQEAGIALSVALGAPNPN